MLGDDVMEDFEIKAILENEIFIEGNCPDIINDGNFTVDCIDDISIVTNTPDYISGSCTIEANHPEMGELPIYGEFDIVIKNGDQAVIFKNFTLE